MKDGLLERIRSEGYWRVVLRPIEPVGRLSLEKCFQEVDRARVAIRGWDFPHVGRREDDQGGTERTGEYFEDWCDWWVRQEFWRMYRSGQFLHYGKLDDDAEIDEQTIALKPFLNVVGCTYSVTEFVEFACRLAASGLYKNGFTINIQLHGTKDRRLVAGRSRVPFFDIRKADVDHIVVERQVGVHDIQKGAIQIANEMLVELFDYFGWNPVPAQIAADQQALYRREFR